MENKYKIIISYIQDLSVEIPNPESLITIRNTTPEYRMAVDISTKPSKSKMVEVVTKLTYSNPNKKKDKGAFQIKYATVIDMREKLMLAVTEGSGSTLSLTVSGI